MTDEEKNDLSNVASISKFTEISCVLASSKVNIIFFVFLNILLKKDYKICLNLYMSCKNRLVRDKVFGWLRTTMALLEHNNDTYALNVLKDLIQNKLTDLLTINSELTRDMVAFFQNICFRFKDFFKAQKINR